MSEDATAKPTCDAAAAPAPSVQSLADKLKETAVLDLAFALDCTGSMSSYIASAQREIHNIVEQIVSAEKADVQFALVSYRDHPPQDSSFITQVHPFTKSISAMKRNLDGCSANGGGDGPEAVEDALHDVLKLDWRPQATKICVLICDAPPHGLDRSGDGFPDGCPLGIDPVVTVNKMAEAGIVLYVVGCEPALARYRSFFMGLAHVTGGQYCPLSSASGLSDLIVAGAVEEISMDRLMADVHREVEESGQAMSVTEQTKLVHKKMAERNVQAKRVKNASAMMEVTPAARSMASKKSLAEVSAEYSADAASSSGAHGYACEMDCAAPRSSLRRARRAAPEAKPGMLTRLWGSLRGRPATAMDEAEEAEADVACARACDDMDCAMPAPSMAAAAPEMKSAPSGGYSVAEEAVSMEQCERLVMKSRAMHKWK